MLQADVRSVKTIPSFSNAGSVVGMLSVHYKKPQPVGETSWSRLQAVANAIARSIDYGSNVAVVSANRNPSFTSGFVKTK